MDGPPHTTRGPAGSIPRSPVSRPPSSWHWAPPLLLAAAAGAVALKALHLSLLLPPCLFRTLTGIPCPSCGGTHCVLALASLDLPRAAAANPLVSLGAVGLAVASVLHAGERILGRPILSPEPLLRRPRLMRALAVTLLLANWAYLVAAGMR